MIRQSEIELVEGLTVPNDKSEGINDALVQKPNTMLKQSNFALNQSDFLKREQLLDMFLLRDKEGNKSVNRVCCIKINKHWTIRRQMICSLMILSSIVFIIVIGIVIGNLILTKQLIQNSSIEAIHQRINDNLSNSAQEYTTAITSIFFGYAHTLSIMQRIVLSALKLDNQLFDFSKVIDFPIQGRQQYFSVNSQVPLAILAISAKAQTEFPNIQVTYQSFQWGAFGTSSVTTLSSMGQKILDACDVLTYFLEDYYYDKTITMIQYIRFSFETDRLTIFYPGGTAFGLGSSYVPSQLAWYSQTKLQYTQNQYTSITITGPYLDQLTNQKLVTISIPIIDMNGVFQGVSAIDMVIQDFQSLISKVDFYSTGFIILVNQNNGIIMNDPYNINQIYYIFDQTVTNLTLSQWQLIKDPTVSFNQTLSLVDTTGDNILLFRYFINTQGSEFILIIRVEENQAYSFLNSLFTSIDSNFSKIQNITIITICITCFIAIISGCIYSNRIVKPLTQLTDYAININSNTQKPLSDDVKVDLDKIKGNDKIGELIEAFRNLVKGLSGLKKGARSEITIGNEKINFPINFYCGTKMKWRLLLDQLKSYENKMSYIQNSNSINNDQGEMLIGEDKNGYEKAYENYENQIYISTKDFSSMSK